MKKRKIDMMEGWNVGRIAIGLKRPIDCDIKPLFHHSIIPIIRYSIMPVLAALLAAGCGKDKSDATPKPRPAALVLAAKAETRDLTRTVVYTGSIEPVCEARMASPAEGPIMECLVREGDRVVKGQMLVRVGRRGMAESGLDAAREELERQESDFKRIEQLVGSGALPAENLEIARSALKRAESHVAAAETSVDDYDIRAPWDGLVSKVFVAVGNYVAPRAPLVELYDPSSLQVRFAVPERDSLRVKDKLPLKVMLDAFPDRVFDAHIERSYPHLDPVTRTRTFEAVLLTDLPIIKGLFARVIVPVESVADAVTIPEEAPIALPDGSLAVFVEKDGIAVRRKISIGLEADGYIQISEGVQPGENIIVRGQERLRDGAAVRIPDGQGQGPGGGKGGLETK